MEDLKLESKKRVKTTIYMSKHDEMLLDEIFIKKIRDRKKTNRSCLICEGIHLLYKKEIGDPEKNSII